MKTIQKRSYRKNSIPLLNENQVQTNLPDPTKELFLNSIHFYRGNQPMGDIEYLAYKQISAPTKTHEHEQFRIFFRF